MTTLEKRKSRLQIITSDVVRERGKFREVVLEAHPYFATVRLKGMRLSFLASGFKQTTAMLARIYERLDRIRLCDCRVSCAWFGNSQGVTFSEVSEVTQQEALQEARRRWGNNAPKRFGYASRYNEYLVVVGCWADGVEGFQRAASGEGQTWESAFADADQKEAAK